MTHQEFNSLVEERIEKIRKVLSSKGAEYSSQTNRFHNFEVAGRILGCSPEEALFGMLTKHLVSVYDIVKGVQKDLPYEVIDEKITDTINYLILLEGILKEKQK